MTQLWTIQKLEGPHKCTVARMIQDNRKLDAKSICNYIILLVKDIPTIPVSILIADMLTQFKLKGLVVEIMCVRVLWRLSTASATSLLTFTETTRMQVGRNKS
ncbi:hypothetical protein GOBAR_AA35098 [Gossypium barbadense]|uniref:Uncharacterized protein n=1 Tax=Gossypium barbadense TaxID=3634 RepID=A0A2P5W3C8_GOSBA|nr:hypothetical protein GOBAR_AA35098 [Gossypium barbadense]